MAKKNYYAVRVGVTPGIYQTWNECQANINKYPKAEYKGFATREEAEAYMQGAVVNVNSTSYSPEPEPQLHDEVYAFVDGSYNIKTGVFGFGGFLCVGNKKYQLQGSGSDETLSSMRNVAGEIAGAIAAAKKAESLGLPLLTIYYDYAGIEEWALGKWKAEKEGTKAYVKTMKDIMSRMPIRFKKVKGHTGIEGNELADVLAKQAVGMHLTRNQEAMLSLLEEA